MNGRTIPSAIVLAIFSFFAITASAAPTISCNSDPRIFHSATDGAGGVLTSGNDLNWQYGYGESITTPSWSAPTAPSTWAPAVIANTALLTVWAHPDPVTSTTSGWIAQNSAATPPGGNHLYYAHYRYDLTLSPQVDPATFELTLDFYVDDWMYQILLNGVPVYDYASHYPPGTPVGGYTSGTETNVTLKNTGGAQWQTGANTLTFITIGTGSIDGFLATNASMQCTLQSGGQTPTSVPATNPATLGLLAAGLMLAGAGGFFRRRFAQAR